MAVPASGRAMQRKQAEKETAAAATATCSAVYNNRVQLPAAAALTCNTYAFARSTLCAAATGHSHGDRQQTFDSTTHLLELNVAAPLLSPSWLRVPPLRNVASSVSAEI